MIKFFRNIRLMHFTGDRVSKYLLYALGEIILVVIGILIALQINNWNEQRIEREIGLEYLQRVRNNLLKDQKALEDKIDLADRQQQSYRDFISSIYKEQSNLVQVKKLITSVNWDSANLILEDRTYVEMTNSGQFNFIEDSELRDKITDYYSRYYNIDAHISEMNQTSITMHTDGVFQKTIKYVNDLDHLYDSSEYFNKEAWAYINNPKSEEFQNLESVALFYYYKQGVFEGYYKELRSMNDALLTDIDEELAFKN